MDIVASILAYLTCVAGIVGAFLVSFYMVFAAPGEPIVPEHRAAVANTTPIKVATPKTSGVKGDRLDKRDAGHLASAASKHGAGGKAVVAGAASGQTHSGRNLAANDARPKGQMSRAQWRWMVEHERARRFAYQQQSPDFEPRFLGYAD